MKILVLGTDGMLGSAVYDAFSNDANFEILGTSRRFQRNRLQFDVETNFVKDLEVNRFDYVINCIGVIKQKIKTEVDGDLERTWIVNSDFPRKIASEMEGTNSKLLQIATDCVFSGEKGNYLESDLPNPVDVYGESKLKGEIFSDNVLNLRGSIIGRERQGSSSLLEWFLSQPKNSTVQGFTNHYWNGLTTYQFARIFRGVILGGEFRPGTFHLVPKDVVSKYELLNLLGQNFGRTDLLILPSDNQSPVNRSLSTNHPEFNSKLWESAGYSQLPSIEEMIQEFSSMKLV